MKIRTLLRPALFLTLLFTVTLLTPTLYAAPAQTYVVNTNSDLPDGGICDAENCTLREAMETANSHIGPDNIHFAIPGNHVHTIHLSSALPTITDPLNMDGYTQNGASPNTLAQADNAVLKIVFDCTNAGPYCLNITAGSTLVRGLLLNHNATAIYITSGDANRIEGNFIGTDPTGEQAEPGETGIEIATSDNVVGGKTPDTRNLIADQTTHGIALLNSVPDNNTIRGNYIGTNKEGTAALGNADGIHIVKSINLTILNNLISGNQNGIQIGSPSDINSVRNNLIGTDATGTKPLPNTQTGFVLTGHSHNDEIFGNVISANGGNGIQIGDAEAPRFNIFSGNFIGTDKTRSKKLGNGGFGILVVNADDTLFGAHGKNGGNVIMNNGDDGINIQNGTGDLVTQNSIFKNGSVGIDLGTGNVTPNDDGDPDGGPNGRQNYPILTLAKSSNGKITGIMNSILNTTYTVEFFSSPSCDPSLFGEGKTYLGSQAVAIGATNDVPFSLKLPGTFAKGEYITTTATDANNNTSEFSACLKAK